MKLPNCDTLSPILSSSEFVVQKSRKVFFHPEALGPAVGVWGAVADAAPTWAHPCHLTASGDDDVQWILVLDVLNHSFWPDPGDDVWTVAYGGLMYSGYWGLAASLRRALEEGYPLTDAGYLSEMNKRDLQTIFRGQGTIPLPDARLANLREAGRVLAAHWNGHIIHLLENAGMDALRTVTTLVDSFPSFRDECTFEGRKVFFWKRAQLFVSDVHQAFSGRGRGAFLGMDRLTAFADYKLPQVLRELGILSYEKGLADRVDACVGLEWGSREEVEIRAHTIWAVEQLKEEFLRQGMAVTSSWVDNWLWGLGQRDEFRRRPYHRCRTIYY